MTNAELAQAWANQLKDSGTGSNLFFVGNIIYSYGRHYVAGVLIPEKGIAVINKTKRSVTTSRHVNYVIKATEKRYKQIFAYYPEDPKSNTYRTIEELFLLLVKANKARNRGKIINEMKNMLIELKEYNEAVGYEPTEQQEDALEDIGEVLENE